MFDFITRELNIASDQIPEGWQITTIRDVVSFSRKPRGLPLGTNKIPFIPMALLPEDGLFTTRWESRSEDEVRSGVYFQNGDVLLSKITPCLENGKLAIAEGIPTGWGIASTEVYPIKPERVTANFLAFYLKMPSVRLYLTQKMQGATGRQRLPKEALEACPIPIPPFAEQEVIGQLLTTVQKSKESNRSVLNAMRVMKSSLSKHMFDYGISRTSEITQVALKETEIGMLPDTWRVVSLGDAAEFLQYGTSQRCDDNPSGNPVLRIPNVIGDSVDYTDLKYLSASVKETNKYMLQSGDLLFVRTNGRRDYIGRCCVYGGKPETSLFASYLIRARLRTSIMIPQFLRYYAQTQTGRSFLSGRASNAADGKYNINTQILKGMLIPCPPLEIQQQIVQILEAVEHRELVFRRRLAAVNRLFESLSYNLMTGKIRVGEFALA